MQYASKKSDNRLYTSQPFYTSENGYNLAIELYINGCSTVKGTHLSAFVEVMKGRNDYDLLWPFIGWVTIRVLNQLQDKNHYSKTIALTKEAKMHSGCRWGFNEFISYCDENSVSK